MAQAEKKSCGQRMSGIGRFCYNKEHGTFCGRTAKSWFLITLFYLIFFSLLGGFFVGMLSVLLFGIIEESRPHLTGQQSIIRMNPGLGFRPIPDVEKTLIKVNQSDKALIDAYVASIKKFYDEYSTTNKSFKAVGKMEYPECNLNNSQANVAFNPFEKICRMNPDISWGPNCSVNNSFGYKEGQPCVIIKINRIFGWLPSISDAYPTNHTLFRCEPENDGDKVTFAGSEPEYFPGIKINGTSYGYFSSALFPFLNQPGYTSPSVAVKFSNLRRNVLVMIQCRLVNLLNSVYSKVEREAMTRFEILILSGK